VRAKNGSEPIGGYRTLAKARFGSKADIRVAMELVASCQKLTFRLKSPSGSLSCSRFVRL
jgi:hypothetical protein